MTNTPAQPADDPAEYFFDDGGYGADSDVPDLNPERCACVEESDCPHEWVVR